MSTPNQCIKLTFVIWLRYIIMTLEIELRYRDAKHVVIYQINSVHMVCFDYHSKHASVHPPVTAVGKVYIKLISGVAITNYHHK